MDEREHYSVPLEEPETFIDWNDFKSNDELALHVAKVIIQKFEKNRNFREEMVSESMVRYVQSKDQFQGQSIKEFVSWMTKIAKNARVNYLRDCMRQKRDIRREIRLSEIGTEDFVNSILTSNEAEPVDQLVKAEEELRRQKIIDECDENGVFSMRMKGMQLAEIGLQIGKSRNATRGILRRSRGKMREMNAENPA